MIDPLAMPVFKPLWEAFPYLPGCFAAWRIPACIFWVLAFFISSCRISLSLFW